MSKYWKYTFYRPSCNYPVPFYLYYKGEYVEFDLNANKFYIVTETGKKISEKIIDVKTEYIRYDYYFGPRNKDKPNEKHGFSYVDCKKFTYFLAEKDENKKEKVEEKENKKGKEKNKPVKKERGSRNVINEKLYKKIENFHKVECFYIRFDKESKFQFYNCLYNEYTYWKTKGKDYEIPKVEKLRRGVGAIHIPKTGEEKNIENQNRRKELLNRLAKKEKKKQELKKINEDNEMIQEILEEAGDSGDEEDEDERMQREIDEMEIKFEEGEEEGEEEGTDEGEEGTEEEETEGEEEEENTEEYLTESEEDEDNEEEDEDSEEETETEDERMQREIDEMEIRK